MACKHVSVPKSQIPFIMQHTEAAGLSATCIIKTNITVLNIHFKSIHEIMGNLIKPKQDYLAAVKLPGFP